MLDEKKLRKAIHAFIVINWQEAFTDLEYVTRLANGVKCLGNDEEYFEILTALFDNETICNHMIEWIEAVQ